MHQSVNYNVIFHDNLKKKKIHYLSMAPNSGMYAVIMSVNGVTSISESWLRLLMISDR